MRVLKFLLKLLILVCCLGLLWVILQARIDEATLVTEPPVQMTETIAALPPEPTPDSVDISAAPEAAATPTPVPTPEPTPEPPKEYVISMIGDCTLWSNANYANHPAGYAGTMGEDYAYPFSNTVQYFADDEYTLANLECVLSDKALPYDYTVATFSFLAPTAYTNVLLEGGVDFVTVANNHIMDCYEAGLNSTCAALEEYGLPYGRESQSQIVTTKNGLKLGIYTAGTNMRPDWKTEDALSAIAEMRANGAEYVICMFHWGNELYYKPFDYQTELAHKCIDAGADLIYGSHSHCLNPMEEYSGGLILYSMGNWTFGGSTMPSDPDTAIVQVTLRRDDSGALVREGCNVIPCCVSSKIDEAQTKTQNYNDYRPTPYPEETDPYYRVLSKLDGSFEPDSQGVDYSNWYASRATG